MFDTIASMGRSKVCAESTVPTSGVVIIMHHAHYIHANYFIQPIFRGYAIKTLGFNVLNQVKAQ